MKTCSALFSLTRSTWHYTLSSLLALALLFAETRASYGVILFGSGDPLVNTTAPSAQLGGSTWEFEGQWGGFLGTVIGSEYFIAARHVGGAIGQTFLFQGVPYTTTAYYDDPSGSDLRIWEVDGVFPFFAPLYMGTNEVGKKSVVYGRGTRRGGPIETLLTHTNFTILTDNLKDLGLSKKEASNLYPSATFKGQTMTRVLTNITTEVFLHGWKFGVYDGVMRWGTGKVFSSGSFLSALFQNDGDPNKAYLSGGDSSGAVFIEDSDGLWKLAGINSHIEGPYGLYPNDPNPVDGAIFDLNGLYFAGTAVEYSSGQPAPAAYYATRISISIPWIESVIRE